MNLLAATLLLLVSSGRWAIPIAAWLSPVFLLRFARGGRARWRLAAVAATLYGTGCLTWWGMAPVPPPLYFLILLGITLPGVVPYAVSLILARRAGGFATTLVFPSAWVVSEYLTSLLSPYGSWGAVAYTQVDHLALVQSAAVAGLWGIAFLIAWSAAVLNWAWERGFAWSEVRRGLLTWAGTLAAVLLIGGARMAFAPPAAPSVRVATLVIPPPAHLAPGVLLSRRASGAALESLRTDLHAHEQELFAAVRREAGAGARLVAWSEVGAFVLRDEAQAFEERAAREAREAGVHLITGIALFMPGEGYYENLWIGFDSTGTRIGRYHKARPVPGDPERGADAEIPVVTTPLGRLAGAVCFDADFPNLIRRAGEQRADLLVIPSSDWRDIDPIHTRMALLRGVENGCSVIRPTHKGLSAAADYQGRILAATDHFRAASRVMVAQVPSRGVWTLYPRLPGLLPALCMALLIGTLVVRLVRDRRG